MVKDASQQAKEAALAGFRDMGPGHVNCAQAVVRFASMVLGADQDSVVLARYFGGGITRMGQVCGALSGSAISLGLRDRCLGLSWPDGASPDTEKLQPLFRQFEAEFGALTCRELVGYVTDTSGGLRHVQGRREVCVLRGLRLVGVRPPVRHPRDDKLADPNRARPGAPAQRGAG